MAAARTNHSAEYAFALPLLGLRIVLAIYALQWAWLNAKYPAAAGDVYARWYGAALPEIAIQIFGFVSAAFGLMMLLGLLRRLSYVFNAGFIGLMVLLLLPHLLNPYGFHQPPNWVNRGLIAQVPVAVAFVTLVILARFDRHTLDCVFGIRPVCVAPAI